LPDPIYYQAADLILQALGASPQPASVNMLVAWMEQEYTADELAATNNPLATSLRGAGADGYCTLPNGERSSEPCYDTLADGAAACAATLQNGLYPDLVQGLVSADPGAFFSAAGLQELAVWAGGPGSPNYAYAARVQSTYGSLPAPPSWALAGGAGGGQPPPPPPVLAPPRNPAGVVAGALLLLGGAAAVAWALWPARR
jgi:hypothetical protein